VGKLRRPHGLRGEILMDVYTDYPERLTAGKQLYIGETHLPVRLAHTRWHGEALLISFKGYPDPESVGQFRNQLLFAAAADRPSLPEGEYYHHQLIGLRVITEDGQALGVVSQVLETGANDVCVVRRPAGAEILLPLIDPVILAVNLAQGEMQVHLLPGLLDEDIPGAGDDAEA
jgi:16S rRNA processing protein RimM